MGPARSGGGLSERMVGGMCSALGNASATTSAHPLNCQSGQGSSRVPPPRHYRRRAVLCAPMPWWSPQIVPRPPGRSLNTPPPAEGSTRQHRSAAFRLQQHGKWLRQL